MDVFELVSENLSNLGGPMGTEFTFPNFKRNFDSIKKAQEAAEKDYKKPLKWFKTGNSLHTEDLGYVMYHINKLVIE
jgi:hypothetical protein